MNRFGLPLALLLLVPPLGGCQIRPDQGPPGTVYYQRSRAVVHDPFPNPDIGPPIEGARPLEYERPLSEVKQNQTSPFATRRSPGF